MSKMKKVLQSHVFLTLVAIVVAFIVGAIFLVVMGYDPIKIYGALIEGIFSKPKYLAYSVVYATPLIFVGLAVAFSFKTGVFNIGAEGQFVAKIPDEHLQHIMYKIEKHSPIHLVVKSLQMDQQYHIYSITVEMMA